MKHHVKIQSAAPGVAGLVWLLGFIIPQSPYTQPGGISLRIRMP